MTTDGVNRFIRVFFHLRAHHKGYAFSVSRLCFAAGDILTKATQCHLIETCIDNWRRRQTETGNQIETERQR